ncbi:hypothetical protein AAC387_Pa02g1410 [Persea americana]
MQTLSQRSCRCKALHSTKSRFGSNKSISDTMILMEGAVSKQLLSHGNHILYCTQSTRCCIQTPFVKLRPGSTAGHMGSSVDLGFPKMTRHTKLHVKMFAIRRRRAYLQTDTYVLMEPGKSEEFVSEEELKARLKGWLENWPGDALPPDLARFKTTDDAVSHLVKSVCELEIDGEIGTIQWYEVRLE